MSWSNEAIKLNKLMKYILSFHVPHYKYVYKVMEGVEKITF